jgi:hypothetical protein
MSLVDKKKLRGGQGHYKTVSLFYENAYDSDAPFTLKEEDFRHYLAPKPRYVAAASEYEAALSILGSWDHWKALKKCKWFIPTLESWEAERCLREETEAKKILIEEAENGNVTAAKAIYDQGKQSKRGRPSKAEKAKVLTKEQEMDEFLAVAMDKVIPISKAKKK